MARTAEANRRQMYHDSDEVMKMRSILVKMQEELDALYAKLDADAGVTDTDYAATLQAMTPSLATLVKG